jgi:hypothetical protein
LLLRKEISMYKYFVSYNHVSGCGNVMCCRNKKIKDISDIRSIARDIEKDSGFEENSVVIMYYNRM